MLIYYQAEDSTVEPVLVNVTEQGLRTEHGAITEDDTLMELAKWVEVFDNDILNNICQQVTSYVVSGQHPML